jgi:hypothetical protein
MKTKIMVVGAPGALLSGALASARAKKAADKATAARCSDGRLRPAKRWQVLRAVWRSPSYLGPPGRPGPCPSR